MATPSCPKCANTTFEMKEVKIDNASYRHNVIICRSCGSIVGTEEIKSLMFMLMKIGEKLGLHFGQ